MSKINGFSLENLPWEDRPSNSSDIVWRYSKNPIIKRNPIPNAARIFNSAVVPYKGEFIGVFRADQKNGRPQLYSGSSKDGINWNINNTKINWVDLFGNPAPTNYAYDPRVVNIEQSYYITWCTDFHGPTIGVGKTDDFKTFTRLENAYLPFNRNGVLFPRKINGRYMMLNRPSDNGHTPFGDIFLSESPDLQYWGVHRYVMKSGTKGWWQTTKIGAGPIPIETTDGWLLFYHGVITTCNGFVYSMGAALLDLDHPEKVLYRTRDYLLTPEMEYETIGFVPNVVFPCAALTDAKTGKITLYYGAADTYVAMAFTTVDLILEYLKNNSELDE